VGAVLEGWGGWWTDFGRFEEFDLGGDEAVTVALSVSLVQIGENGFGLPFSERLVGRKDEDRGRYLGRCRVRWRL